MSIQALEALNIHEYKYDDKASYQVIVRQDRTVDLDDTDKKWYYRKSFTERSEYEKCVNAIKKSLAEGELGGRYTILESSYRENNRKCVEFVFNAREEDIPDDVIKHFRLLQASRIGRLFYLKLARDKWLKALEGYLFEQYYHHVYLFYVKDSETILVYMSNYPETFDLRGGGYKHVYPSHIDVYETLTHPNYVQRASLTLFEMMSTDNFTRVSKSLRERLERYENMKQAKPIVEAIEDENLDTILQEGVLYRFNDNDAHGLRLVEHTAIQCKQPFVLVKDIRSKQQYFYYDNMLIEYLNDNAKYLVDNGIRVQKIVQPDTALNEYQGFGITIGDVYHENIINVLSIITSGKVYNQYPSLTK